MVNVDVSTLWFIIAFAAIGILASFPIIYKATRTFWQSVWYIMAVHKHKGSMSKAFKMLPRLAHTYYKTSRASENIYPHLHLVYHFGVNGRVENRITQDHEWLEYVGKWLPGTEKGDFVKMHMRDEDDNVHRLNIKRTTLVLTESVHDILVVKDFSADSFITAHFAHEMWQFLPTVRFYGNTIDYVLIENCPDEVGYISAMPNEIIEHKGKRYSVFSCPESFPHIDLEPLRA